MGISQQQQLSHCEMRDSSKVVMSLAACSYCKDRHFQERAWHHAVLTSACDVVKRSVLTSRQDHGEQFTEAERAVLKGKWLEYKGRKIILPTQKHGMEHDRNHEDG